MRLEALVTVGGGLGDVVMSTPVISAAYQLGYTVDVLLKGDIECAVPMIESWPIIRRIYVGMPPAGKKYDIVIRSWWHRDIKLDSGPEVRPDFVSLRNNHEIIANMGAVRKLGFVGPTPPTHVPVDGRCAAFDLPEHYAVLSVGFTGKQGRAFWKRKEWPHWSDFAVVEKDMAFVALGSKSDAANGLKVVGSNVMDLVGKTSIHDAVAIIKGADFVVALDNGLAHVAAALGKSVFVLFGATSEIKSRPLGREVTVLSLDLPCRPCQMTDAWKMCKDWKCMSEITPEFVWNSIKESWNDN